MAITVARVAPSLAVAFVLTACGGSSNTGDNARVVHVPANLCALLSAADISQVMGRTFPSPQSTQNAPSEQDCDAVPSVGNDVSFKLYWNNLYCFDGKPADQQCLNSQSQGFATNKQTASPVQDVSGLGDQAFCFTAPPATVEVLKGWIYIWVTADTCAQAQKLAGMLLAKLA